MKAVLISIQPKWVEKIASGEKTIEVRKTKPNLETPFKCYIYETKGYDTLFGKGKPKKLCVSGGRVIGEFVCKGIMQPFDSLRLMAKESCLTENELFDYSKGKTLYGWRIADLKIYDKPKELSEFKKADCDCPFPYVYMPPCPNCDEKDIKKPPQSWCYVEDLQGE